MQAARLTQDYYGFFRQPAIPRKDAGAGKPEAGRSQATVLPAERVVEGEVLRNRSAPSNDTLDQILQRGRFSFAGAAANSPDASTTSQSAQRAINAYLDNVATSGAGGGRSHTVDFYV